MKVRIMNDWKTMLAEDKSLGYGFGFLVINYIKVSGGEGKINGFVIMILGVGLRFSRR